MVYHWDASQPAGERDICWGMPPLGTTIEPGRTWWESTDEGEPRSDTVAWEIFQSVVALLATEELAIPSSDVAAVSSLIMSGLEDTAQLVAEEHGLLSGGDAAASSRVTWLLAS